MVIPPALQADAQSNPAFLVGSKTDIQGKNNTLPGQVKDRAGHSKHVSEQYLIQSLTVSVG